MQVVKWCAIDQVPSAPTPGHLRGVGMVTAREAATCPALSSFNAGRGRPEDEQRVSRGIRQCAVTRRVVAP
jgi:hypothetical protein